MAFSLGNKAESTMEKVLGVVVVISLLGGVAVTFFASIKSLVTAFNNTSATGNSTADLLLPTLGLVIAILGVFALIKLVSDAVKEN